MIPSYSYEIPRDFHGLCSPLLGAGPSRISPTLWSACRAVTRDTWDLGKIFQWYTLIHHKLWGILMDTHGYQTLTKPFMLWSLFLPNPHGQDRQCLDWIWTLGQTQTLKHRFPAVDPTGICSILASNWMLRRVRFLCWGFCVCCSKSEFSPKKIFVRCCPLADLGPSRDSEPLCQKTTWKCVGDHYYHIDAIYYHRIP